MQNLLFVLVSLLASAHAVGPAMLTSAAQPVKDTSLVPVKDFSVLLSFSERVQKGTGTITVRPCGYTTSATCGVGCTWDTSGGTGVCRISGTQNSHTASCSGTSGKLEFFDKVVLVPITTELNYEKTQNVNVPSTCFKGTDGETLSADYFGDSYKFKTDVSARCSVSTNSPQRMSGDAVRKDTSTYVPLDPAADAWVTTSKKWTLYFSEAVQAGEGMISIKETSGKVGETLLTSFTAADTKVQFKGVGKVELQASAFSYKQGKEYTLELGAGAFKDRHNNFADEAFKTTGKEYRVKVATKFDGSVSGGYTAAGQFPKAGCCNSSFNFTSNYKLVWTFQDEVIPARAPAGKVSLCTNWVPDNACKSPISLATGDMIFLGKTVILNPQGKMTDTTPKTYNVSIPSTVFAYYDGLSAASDRSWTYSFTANLGSFDFTPPELVTGLVSCTGDSGLTQSTTNFYTQTCDNDIDGTHDFHELYDSLAADGNTPLRIGSKFKLYFKEKVTFAANTMKATLKADDDTAEVDVKKTDSAVEFGTGVQDCTVTISPTLKTGKKYTLSVASGQIVDAAMFPNAYAGTSFTFYTTLTSTAPTVFPANTATLVPKETAIKITFTDQPRLGPTPGQSVGIPKIMVGGSSYDLNDTNRVKFQDNQVVILPLNLQAAKTYTVSIAKHHLRYMTTDLAFSFTTRAEDTMPPSPLLFNPVTNGAAKTSKLALDPKAPWILFSEGIAASATASITMKSANEEYKIATSDTTCTDVGGCIEIDTDKNKVWMYPLGKTTATATAWVTAGKTYTVEIPSGAFTDSLTTGVNRNPMAKYTTSIFVDADAAGPTINPLATVTYGPLIGGTTMISTATVDPSASQVELAFNENIQAGPTTGGNSYAIKTFPYSIVQPELNAYKMDTTDNAFPTTYTNNKKQTISLIFDSKVQAGSGAVSVTKIVSSGTDTLLGSAVDANSRTFVGNKMIFKPTVDMVAGESYYVVATRPVLSSDPDASQVGGLINTKSSETAVTFVASADSAASAPLPLWSNLDEYHCMPGDGKIPDVDVYWNEDVQIAATGQTTTAYIYGCTGTSDCGSTTTAQAFKKQSYPTTGQTINAKINSVLAYKLEVSMITGTKVVAYDTALTTGATRSFWLGANVVYDLSTTNTNKGTGSAAKGYTFTICEVKYDTPTSSLVRLYTTAFGVVSGQGLADTRQFEVIVPPSAVRDTLSNQRTATQTLSFTHETVAPTVDPSSSNPASGTNMGLRENILIAFNEVVQAGTGKFQIYSAGGHAYEIPVMEVDSGGSNLPSPLFLGNKVYITPKTLCKDSRRRASLPVIMNASTNATFTTTTGTPRPYGNGTNWSAGRRLAAVEEWEEEVEQVLSQWSPTWSESENNAEQRRLVVAGHPFWDPHCSDVDFELSTTYWVEADTAGVVKDVVGNKLAKINTKHDQATWTFQTGTGLDATSPVVVAHEATGGTAASGRIYFSEFVTQAATASAGQTDFAVKVVDCGATFKCTGSESAETTGLTLSYGDGSAQTARPSNSAGSKEYGMLTFAKTLSTNNRKYKVSVVSSKVKDFPDTSTARTGPTTDYTFYISRGTVPLTDPNDSDGPTIAYGPTVSTAIMTVSPTITLFFNEDIQSGSGTISFCTNSNADGSTVDCTLGKTVNPAGTEVDATLAAPGSGSIDRRKLSLSMSNFKIGQTLYTMLPAGTVKDISTASNSMPLVKPPAYTFKVEEKDTVKPMLLYRTVPTLTSGNVVLYFSEAIQSSDSPVTQANLTISGAGFANLPLKTTVSGNKVSLSLGTSGGGWTAGVTYQLQMQTESFIDLDSNELDETSPAISMSTVATGFAISSDTTKPTTTAMSPATSLSGNANKVAGTTSVFALKFSEVVQKGTGKISVYSSPTGAWPGTPQRIIDVLDVPMHNEIDDDSGGNNIKSKIVVAPYAPGSSLPSNVQYSLRIPNTAFKDLGGNSYDAMTGLGTYVFTVTTKSDCTDPKMIMASFGGTGSPNPAYTSNVVTMYFTETVQSVSTATAALKASGGGSFCSAGGACAPGATCNAGCGYTAAAGTDPSKYFTSFSFQDAVVNATGITGLQVGKGYKLHIERSAFNDVAGNSLPAAIDGDGNADTVYALQVPAAATDTIGPQHVTTSTPALTGARPSGVNMVPPSSTVEISFTENVQAGTGSISFMKLTGGSEALGTSTAVSDCMFSGTRMICDPVGDLLPNTIYSVKYDAASIKDAVGNTHAALETIGSGTTYPMKFTTIDKDYETPKLVATSSGTSYAARRLYASPQDPANGAINVAKGTVLALTFTETVQAGAGSISIKKSTAGGVSPSIEVSSSKLHFSGSTVYIQIGAVEGTDALTAGATYSVTTSYPTGLPQQGVFKDVAGNDCAKNLWEHIGGTAHTFTVVPDDEVKPTVLQYLPKQDITVADDAPTTDIILYFSESVQAIAGQRVTVAGVSIPVDNTNPAKGSVFVTMTQVTIDPFDDLEYNQNVGVQIGSGAFKDYQSNSVDAISYNFKTPPFEFKKTLGNNASTITDARRLQAIPGRFDQMEGASLHVITDGITNEDYLLLFGGEKGGTSYSASNCISDTYTSSTGATWLTVTSKSNSSTVPLPAIAYAKTAQDESGCIWMMASQYCGRVPAAGTIWMTCGVEDDTLLWFPQSPPVAKGNSPEWPYASTGIQGHAIAVIGGWQLVVVDAMNQKVWAFEDKAATIVSQVAGEGFGIHADDFPGAGPTPWSKRADPILLTDTLNNLYLIGGYDTALCALTDVFCPYVMTDVWKSMDSGATWTCLTANMASEMTSEYSLGVGRLTNGQMAHDDTIFMIGGAKPNTTLGLNSIWTSYDAATDATKPTYLGQAFEAEERSVLATAASTTDFVLTSSTVKLYFSEAVKLATGGTVTMVDTSNAGVNIAISTSISRQVMTVTKASGTYTAGKTMKISIAASSITDAAGNTLSAAVAQEFGTAADAVAPAVTGSHPAHGSADIVPYTTLTLTFAETVYKNPVKVKNALGFVYEETGIVELKSTLGRKISLDIAEADIVDNKVFWDLGPDRRLTEATLYTVHIPAGLVRDAAFNPNSAHSAYSFTTLSGNYSFNNYINSTTTIEEPIAVVSANDTTKPTFVSMHPAASATDVKCGGEVNVFMFFSEPVKFNESGVIYIVNSSNKVAGTLNLTYDRNFASTRSMAHVEKGVKMSVGPILKKGMAFTVSIPAGVVEDLSDLPIDEVKKSFTCLAEKPDYGPPEIAMITPYNGMETVPSTSYEMTAWFSESIQAGTGSITLKSASASLVTDITNAVNISIAGAKLKVTLPDSFKGPDGKDVQLIIPAGTVKDARGNFFGGVLAAANHKFKISLVDTTAPTLPDLATVLPAKEATMGYAKSLSSSLLIPFSEYMKKGTGHIKASMKYMKKDWTMDVSSPEVMIVGSNVIISPKEDWTPGEIYSVKIDAGAFTDLAGNAYAGLTTGWTMSTKQLINFRLVPPSTAGTNHFDADDYFDGSRYGVSAAFSSTNKLYVLGGRNGTLGGTSQLNDVWIMDTYLPAHCSSSLQPMFECTTDANEPSESNGVTQCSCPAGGCNALKTDAFAGSKNAITQVWKPANAGGKHEDRCMTASNMPTSTVGTVLNTAIRNCPCPKCKVPPFNLSATNPLFNNISDYTFADLLPVTGHNGTLPLNCSGQGFRGYEPSEPFTCEFEDLYTAVYRSPYPRCVKSPCRNAPARLVNGVINCTVPKGHTETCAYECLPGYGINVIANGVIINTVTKGLVTCDLGTFIWNKPVCEGILPGSEFLDKLGNQKENCALGMEYWDEVPVCTKIPSTTPTTSRRAPPPPMWTTPSPSTTIATTTPEGQTAIEIVTVVTSMTIIQVFEANVTSESLLADTGFVDSIETGIAAALGEAYTKEAVTVTGFTLTPIARRLGAADGRRLQNASSSLKVDYEIRVADANAAAVVTATLADPTSNAAFTAAFTAAYTAAEAEKGRTVEGLSVVQSTATTVKTETVIIPAPTPAPATPAPATTAAPPAPPPATTTAAPASAPTPAPAAEEEEDGSAAVIGGVVGGIGGAAVLGGAFFMYKKKSQASE